MPATVITRVPMLLGEGLRRVADVMNTADGANVAVPVDIAFGGSAETAIIYSPGYASIEVCCAVQQDVGLTGNLSVLVVHCDEDEVAIVEEGIGEIQNTSLGITRGVVRRDFTALVTWKLKFVSAGQGVGVRLVQIHWIRLSS